jgi:hypothetical protein
METGQAKFPVADTSTLLRTVPGFENPGSVSHEVAQKLALAEYDKFNAKRLKEEAALPDKDFEEVVRMIKEKDKK